MQVINILRDDGHIVLFFQFCQHLVRMVGLYLQEVLPPGIVEVEHCLRVFLKADNAGQFPGIILLPHPIVVTEGGYSTFFADSSTCEDHDILSSCHCYNAMYRCLVNVEYPLR